MQLSTDDETNFDIFDFMKCDEVPDCTKLFTDKDDLALNGDLVNKYENNLGLDIVKDKNVCWAAGNFDNDICPLRNYELYNDNSLLNFPRDSLDYESRESFSQGWTFDENIEYVSQEHIPDSQIIVPKKTVDITKIKGWRKKQFTIEKCLANNNSVLKKTVLKPDEGKVSSQSKIGNVAEQSAEGVEEDANKDYAFVCDKLDDFLDQEAELKINYEIPHLYAEYGIKLTSEELVSRPKFNLMNEDKYARSPKPEIITNVPSVNVINPVPETSNKKTEKLSLTKKTNPKTKCAFPDKSQKTWSLWKENNLTKGKPMSLLKKEFAVTKENVSAVASSCRRSTRIMHNNSLNKPKISVGEDINHCKSNEKANVEVEGNTKCVDKFEIGEANNDMSSDYNFKVSKFGLVLYPGPFVPLNPFIRFHLQKIRSYQTLIDNKWANFAASAVMVKSKPGERKRMVLPLTCCFKYKKESPESLPETKNCTYKTEIFDETFVHSLKDNCECESASEENIDDKGTVKEAKDNATKSVCDDFRKENIRGKENKNRNLSKDSESRKSVKQMYDSREESCGFFEEDIKCRCDDKFDGETQSSPSTGDELSNSKFTLEKAYERSHCDIVFENKRPKTSIDKCISENLRNSPEVIDIEDDIVEVNPTVRLSPDLNQTDFNQIITKLLTKKLNDFKSAKKITNSIDKLKTHKPNALELIKLNFVKENFLSGYINLWCAKMEAGKSRVFLTFSMNPPMEGAINLKMTSRFSNDDLPSIINEIVTKDKPFDPNDFAILYCDGKLWEIHGSVNFTINKSDSSNEKIQVFHLTKKAFQELQMLHDVKQKEDKNKVLKWWVMHMTQNYTEIIIRNGEQIGRVSRSIIWKTWKTKIPSFIEFKGLKNLRPVGVAINPKLWPYFLIGPYYTDDQHNLTLKLNSKAVPFEYYLPLDRVKQNFLLKRFVSSVIMHSWRNGRQVTGMWLYDRVALGQSNFIQVRTKLRKTENYKPSTEHDYSLSKTQDVPEEKLQSASKVRQSGGRKKKNKTEEIYLVPNVPYLGFLRGLLHPDQSVTIEHPFKPDRKINSYRIGDLLNRVLKKRIKFIRSTFNVKWRIVKCSSVLNNRKPFDKSILRESHIMCRKKLFRLSSLTKEKMKSLGFDDAIIAEIETSQDFQEVKEIRELGKMLKLKGRYSKPHILQLALIEIEKLENEASDLDKNRTRERKKRDSLCQRYLDVLEQCEMDEDSRRTITFYITRLLESSAANGKGNDMKEHSRRLNVIHRFLKDLENSLESKRRDDTLQDAVESTASEAKETKMIRKTQSEGPGDGNNDREKSQNNVVYMFETKIKILREKLEKMSTNDVTLREALTKRLNAMSENLKKIKGYSSGDGQLPPRLRNCALEPESSSNSNSLDWGEKFVRDESVVEVLEVDSNMSSSNHINVGTDGTNINALNECDIETNSGSRGSSRKKDMWNVKENNKRSLLKKELTSKEPAEDAVESSQVMKKEYDNPVEKETEKVKIHEALVLHPKILENLKTCSRPEVLSGSLINSSVFSDSSSDAEEIDKITKFDSGSKTVSQNSLVIDKKSMRFNALKSQLQQIGDGRITSLKKPIKIKLLRPHSFSDVRTLESLGERMEYMDVVGNRNQVLLVKKRKIDPGSGTASKKAKKN